MSRFQILSTLVSSRSSCACCQEKNKAIYSFKRKHSFVTKPEIKTIRISYNENYITCKGKLPSYVYCVHHLRKIASYLEKQPIACVLKMLGLYLDALKIGHKFCNM